MVKKTNSRTAALHVTDAQTSFPGLLTEPTRHFHH